MLGLDWVWVMRDPLGSVRLVRFWRAPFGPKVKVYVVRFGSGFGLDQAWVRVTLALIRARFRFGWAVWDTRGLARLVNSCWANRAPGSGLCGFRDGAESGAGWVWFGHD